MMLPLTRRITRTITPIATRVLETGRLRPEVILLIAGAAAKAGAGAGRLAAGTRADSGNDQPSISAWGAGPGVTGMVPGMTGTGPGVTGTGPDVIGCGIDGGVKRPLAVGAFAGLP